jgi:hypothetical protein
MVWHIVILFLCPKTTPGLPGQCRIIEHKTEAGKGKNGRKRDTVILPRPVRIIKKRLAIPPK